MALLPKLESFIWGEGGRAMTPEQVARERELAAMKAQRAGDTSPVGHWTAGAARMVDALGGVLGERRADRADAEGMERYQDWQSRLGTAQAGLSPVVAALSAGMSQQPPSPVAMALATQAGQQGGMQPAGSPQFAPDGSIIRQGLVQRGLPEHVADAFVMNFQDESGLNPGINEISPVVPGSRGGFGLAQWTGPRRRQLEAFAAQRGTSPGDMDTQLDFLMTELQGPESRAAQSILSAQDTGSAAAAIVNNFLRPAEEHRARREASYLGGASPMSGAQPAGMSPDVVSLLMEGMSDPWIRQQGGPVIEALMGQHMQQQDPMYQAQLQHQQLQNRALMNPARPDPVYQGGQWWDISSGQPQALTDAPAAELPGTAQTLAWRAQEAGLVPGSPEYQQFMVDNGGGQTINNILGGESLTPGQKKIDEAFADTYLDWTGGGFADVSKQIDQLNEAISIIDGNNGNISGAIGLLPNNMQAFVNPQGTIAREAVEEVVQRSLREILGAQFTEKEGERLIARAYNPLLPPEENRKRVGRLLGQISSMAKSRQAMVDYFDENGTLRGYRGDRPSAASLDSLMASDAEMREAGFSSETVPDGVSPDVWAVMTEEEKALFQ